MTRLSCSASLVSLLILLPISGIYAASFIVSNRCDYTVWPGIVTTGKAALSSTGFVLLTGESQTLSIASGWTGRFWGRTLCREDSTGNFSCVTGDCGSGKIECGGGSAAPPVTLAEFTLGTDGSDFYDVSLVDGYNLPMSIQPLGSGGNCTVAGCEVDINSECPAELRVTSNDSSGNVACKSACTAFGDPQYCCTGDFANSDTCRPTSYSDFFKVACPRAVSYPYDHSIFTCAHVNYLITFCPSSASLPTSLGCMSISIRVGQMELQT